MQLYSSVAFQDVFYLIMASNSQSSSTPLNVQVLTNALSLFTNAVQAAASNSSTSQSVSINQSDLVDGTTLLLSLRPRHSVTEMEPLCKSFNGS